MVHFSFQIHKVQSTENNSRNFICTKYKSILHGQKFEWFMITLTGMGKLKLPRTAPAAWAATVVVAVVEEQAETWPEEAMLALPAWAQGKMTAGSWALAGQVGKSNDQRYKSKCQTFETRDSSSGQDRQLPDTLARRRKPVPGSHSYPVPHQTALRSSLENLWFLH